MRLFATLLLETNSADAVPCILILLPQSGAAQHIETILLEPSVPLTLYEFADVFGNRCHRTVIPAGPFSLRSTIIADCPDRIDVDPQATFVPMQEVPDDILQFLLPSRYCESDLLGDKAREIAGTSATAYAQVESIRQWINHRFEYVYGITNSSTSALGVIASCRGVCRDYAHAGMALCRSLNIPARMVVGYLYGLYPMDLHAWFEAFIGGRWFTFDATQTGPYGARIVIAYGKDAADVAIATSFTDLEFTRLQVNVQVAAAKS